MRYLLPALAVIGMLSAASGARAERTPVRALAVGDTMPPLSGKDLTGAEVSLPRDLAGRVAFVALGFTYKSRFEVEAWTERVRKAHGSLAGFTFFEVPVMGGSARIARPFIDSGMRKGTPAELHRNVITVWSEAGEWKKRMGFARPDAAYVALVDGGGRLVWMHAGALDDEAFAALGDALATLLPAPREP